MKSVWKVPLKIEDCQEFTAPIGCKPLTVQVQKGTPCMWILVDTEARAVKHTVWVHGTGHPVSDLMAEHYVGTVQVLMGDLVFHVFCKPVG